MTRRFGVLSMVFLVGSASTNAYAQHDLLWQHADGRRAIWTMAGTTMASGDPVVPDSPMDLLPDPLWQVVASGPYFVLFQHQGDGRLTGWSMGCGFPYGTFELSPSQVPDVNWKVRGVGSFSGFVDFDDFWYLFWQNEATGQIAAWQMSRTTRLDGRLLTPSVVPDTDWRIVGVKDFNRDGHSDLLWQHQSSGLIGLWYMNGLTMIAGELLSPEQVPDTNWKIRAIGWFNDDDDPDLIWQHQTTGLVSTWLMKGRQLMAGILLSPDRVADTNWRIVGTLWRDRWECGGPGW